MKKTIKQLTRELAEVTHDRDENADWVARLQEENREQKERLKTYDDRAKTAAEGMNYERAGLLARAELLRQRVNILGFEAVSFNE